jgi:hypothetical protein
MKLKIFCLIMLLNISCADNYTNKDRNKSILLYQLNRPLKEVVKESIYEIQVNHYEDFITDPECSCRLLNILAKKTNELNWEGIYGVRNFNFEWGYTYKLLIKELTIKYNDPAYVYFPTTEYYFINIIEKNKVEAETTFTLKLLSSKDFNYCHITGSKSEGFSLWGIKIIYDNPDFVDKLENIAQEIPFPEKSTYGDFQHVFGESTTIKLIDIYEK